MDQNSKPSNLELAKEYFKRVDANSPDLVEMFAADVQIYFPKFGIGRGTEDLKTFASVFGGTFATISHHFEQFHYVVAGNTVVVEGAESGTLKNGRTWQNTRFCSVFEFRDGLISRMHLYEDPDLTGEHTAGFLWGKTKQDVWTPNESITT
ncbi:MAG: nuclear transport factor 2 family protein [Proteobacteria bacterium]|nr:MAG: nuclear transport factor 2 family protein [Pseudomonadota bacterium]